MSWLRGVGVERQILGGRIGVVGIVENGGSPD